MIGKQIGNNKKREKEMKMKRFIVFALLAAAFVGCENEKSNIPDWFTPTGEMVEIGLGEADTRVSLEFYNDKDNLIWADGDKLGIYSAEAASTAQGYATCANVPATIAKANMSADMKSASVYPQIEFNGAVESHTFYVYYPWSTLGSTNAATPTIAGLQLPTTQNGEIAESTITWASKTVTPTNGKYGRIGNLKLVTPFAYVRFCFSSATAQTKTISSVMMEAVKGTKNSNGVVTVTGSDANAVFCGTYTADLTKSPVSGAEGAEYPEEGAITFTAKNNVITVNGQEAGVTVKSYDKAQGVLMHINSSNAFAGEGNYFRITVMFNDGTYAVTLKEAKNFEANHIYNYGFNIDKFVQETETEIYVEPWHLIECNVAFD